MFKVFFRSKAFPLVGKNSQNMIRNKISTEPSIVTLWRQKNRLQQIDKILGELFRKDVTLETDSEAITRCQTE